MVPAKGCKSTDIHAGYSPSEEGRTIVLAVAISTLRESLKNSHLRSSSNGRPLRLSNASDPIRCFAHSGAPRDSHKPGGLGKDARVDHSPALPSWYLIERDRGVKSVAVVRPSEKCSLLRRGEWACNTLLGVALKIPETGVEVPG